MGRKDVIKCKLCGHRHAIRDGHVFDRGRRAPSPGESGEADSQEIAERLEEAERLITDLQQRVAGLEEACNENATKFRAGSDDATKMQRNSPAKSSRRGRPPVARQPMSNTERSRRRRQKQRTGG